MGKPTMWFLNMSNTNQPVQSQKIARGLKFGFRKKRNCTFCVVKTKTLRTAKLICAFVLAYADCWFSDGVAQL